MNSDIVFIGGGNMATSLISGLRSAGHDGARVTVVEPDADKRERMAGDYGIKAVERASADVLAADVLVLAVKPQMMRDVATALAANLHDADPLVVSIAAGVPLAALRAWLGEGLDHVRCMPNTPSLIGAGATGLYADDSVSAERRKMAESLLATAGVAVWVASEAQLDAVTATSGSGPAYFFAFMEAMQAGAKNLGLNDETARTLVLHTALGAARMALESGDDPGTLRARVTSPGGTTEQALNAFSDGDLTQLVANAMRAAADRAAQLGAEITRS